MFLAQINTKTLSIFRIALSLVSLHQLLGEWDDNCIFFSDDLMTWPQTESQISIWKYIQSGSVHELTQTCREIKLLKFFQLMCNVALLFGFCSSSSSLLCYIFQLSDHRRRIGNTIGGDYILNSLFIWSVLLPTGSHYSFDAWWNSTHNKRKQNQQAEVAQNMKKIHGSNIAILGLRLQIILFYLQSVAFKLTTSVHLLDWNPWLHGTAIRQILHCCEFQKPIGKLMLSFSYSSSLLAMMTWMTLVIESILPLILLLCNPNKYYTIRIAAILTLAAFHIGADMSMALLHFSSVSCVALIVFWSEKELEYSNGHDSGNGNGNDGVELEHKTINLDPKWTTTIWRVPTQVISLTRLILASVLTFIMIASNVHNFYTAYMDLYDLIEDVGLSEGATVYNNLAVDWIVPTSAAIGFPREANMFSVPPPLCGWWALPSLQHNGSIVDARARFHTKSPDAVLKALHETNTKTLTMTDEPTVLTNNEHLFQKPILSSMYFNSDHWSRFYDMLSSIVTLPSLYSTPSDNNDEVILGEMEQIALESLVRFHCKKQPDIQTIKVVFMVEEYTYEYKQKRMQVNTTMNVLWEKECEMEMGNRPAGNVHTYD